MATYQDYQTLANKIYDFGKLDKDGNNTINWKVFENLFGIPKIKDAKYSWLKLNTKFTPNGYDKIDKVFDWTLKDVEPLNTPPIAHRWGFFFHSVSTFTLVNKTNRVKGVHTWTHFINSKKW